MRSALGKGLSALISDETAATVRSSTVTVTATPQNTVLTLPITSVKPNPDQPRRVFAEDSLNDLAASIREKGILQPILVSPRADGTYEIIAGERRWRASQKAGLKEIPALVRAGSESERFQIALIENVQREDLNPMDQANGYVRLMEEFKMTQEDIAKVIGKDRTVIANTVRLLTLPEQIRQAITEGKISASHARALVAVSDPVAQLGLYKRILDEGLSVRATEQAVALHKHVSVKGHVRGATGTAKSPEARLLEEDLQRTLKRKVELQTASPHATKGWLRLEFYSLDDLDQLLEQLKKSGQSA